MPGAPTLLLLTYPSLQCLFVHSFKLSVLVGTSGVFLSSRIFIYVFQLFTQTSQLTRPTFTNYGGFKRERLENYAKGGWMDGVGVHVWKLRKIINCEQTVPTECHSVLCSIQLELSRECHYQSSSRWISGKEGGTVNVPRN